MTKVRHGARPARTDVLRWAPYGPSAVLYYFGEDLGEETLVRGLAIARHLEARLPAGVADFTMGCASVLVEFSGSPGRRLEERANALAAELFGVAARAEEPERRLVEIPVAYDGCDLEDVARATGLDVAEVIRRHSDPVYSAFVIGFMPGFAYLGPVDPLLMLPRRPTPRFAVPAGSVAIAGEHTGVYTVPSAGGWHLLGRTDTRLFDPGRPERHGGACLLRAGDRVKFVPT